MLTLVTGNAGFIGFHVAREILRRGEAVIGIDNVGDYYDTRLKRDRLAELRREAEVSGALYRFIEADLTDPLVAADCLAEGAIDRVIHLAAQPGIGFSATHPLPTVASNVTAFINVLEACRQNGAGHLLYASTSSVYGANRRLPYSEHDDADHPLQLYAATKRADELMAHAYSHLYRLPTTGLRFFTVYGPWGRPDMALSKFAAAILAGQPVELLHRGEHKRDFTYVDDLVATVLAVRDDIPGGAPNWDGNRPDPATSNAPWRLLNVGGGSPARIADLLDMLEAALGRKAIRHLVERRPDDMEDTWADLADVNAVTGIRPKVSLEVGIERFAQWYLEYAASRA